MRHGSRAQPQRLSRRAALALLPLGAALAAATPPPPKTGATITVTVTELRNAKGVVTKETSAVLVILYSPAPEKEAAIQDIRAAYKDRFDQESVMRVDGPTQCVSF